MSNKLTTKPIPIHEVFCTFQGEGVQTGRKAFFIRTQGCPVQCPWCDSAGTWHKDWVPKDIERKLPSELVRLVKQSRSDFVVITGGEPLIHNLSDLIYSLQINGIKVAIETSASTRIQTPLAMLTDCWVTVSPKEYGEFQPRIIEVADEIKIIVSHPDDIMKYLSLFEDWPLPYGIPIWLHPEWSKRTDPTILQAISETVKTYGSRVRAGYQIHKLYNVDALDERSRPLVPLGGVGEVH